MPSSVDLLHTPSEAMSFSNSSITPKRAPTNSRRARTDPQAGEVASSLPSSLLVDRLSRFLKRCHAYFDVFDLDGFSGVVQHTVRCSHLRRWRGVLIEPKGGFMGPDGENGHWGVIGRSIVPTFVCAYPPAANPHILHSTELAFPSNQSDGCHHRNGGKAFATSKTTDSA